MQHFDSGVFDAHEMPLLSNGTRPRLRVHHVLPNRRRLLRHHLQLWFLCRSIVLRKRL